MPSERIPEQFWTQLQQHLGYTDEELSRFRASARNQQVVETGIDMARKTIVFEVVESRGCNSQHKVGTRIFFTGDGNLVSRLAPKRLCAFLMPVMTQMIMAIQELWYAGVDPDQLHFRRAGCFDVGLDCGGWGHVVIEARVLERAEAQKLAPL